MALHPGKHMRHDPEEPAVELDPIRRALQENEDWYRDLVEHSQDLLCIHDLQGRLLSVNPAPARVLGYSVEELLRIPMREIIPPEFRAQFDAYLKQMERAGESQGLMAVMTRSGERRIWEYHNTLRTEGVATPIVRGLAHDVTEQKRAERLLRDASELNRQIIASVNEGVVVYDRDLRCVAWNPFTEKLTGTSSAAALGKRHSEVVPGVAGLDLESVLQRALQGDTITLPDLEVSAAGDGKRWISSRKGPLRNAQGEITGVIATLHDLTDRRQSAALLEASEKRFHAIFDRSPVGIALTDTRTGRLLQVNPKYCEIVGRTEQDILSRDFQSFTHPEDLAQDIENMRRLASEGARHFEIQKRYLRPDGAIRWVSLLVVPMWAEGESPQSHMAMVQDVTERRKAEESLRQSEAREHAKAKELETVLDVVPVPVFIAHDPVCTRITANHAGYEQLHLPKGRNLSKGAAPEEQPSFRVMQDGIEVPAEKLPMQVAAATGKPVAAVPLTLVFEDGTTRETVVNAVPLLGEDGKCRGVIGASIDFTERKRAEEALRRSEEGYRNFVGRSSEGIFRQDLLAPIPVNLPEDELVHHIIHDSFMAECNDAMARMYGLTSAQEFLGKPLTEILVADDPHNVQLTREYIRSGFRVVDRESHEVDVHGSPKVFLNSMIGIVEDGKLMRTWGIQRDVTERVKLEESRKHAEEALRRSEERFRVALSGSPIEVFNQDCFLRYTWVYNLQNGWTEQQFLGKTDEEIFVPDDAARMTALKKRVLETGRSSREEITLTVQGRAFYCDMTVEPLRDAAGAVVGVNSAFVDVTSLHGIMEELRQAKERLAEEKLYLEQEIDTELGFGEIIGHSAALKTVLQQVAKVAASDATVLLLGETGTGKELFARAIHRMSKRKSNSFIKTNCAAIPSGLLESELFGHEKGAFTGAVARKLGRLELADRGTLFLDEIGEISLHLQPKLLRVLQDMEFERLGSTQTLKVNFRLVAATNRDLLDSVNKHEFRSDLFYRLNVFPIRVPPLRERREDIHALVEHFVQQCGGRMGKSITSIPKTTMDALMQWDWPGNVRELENFVERSVILTQGSVLQSPLGELRRGGQNGGPSGESKTP